MEVNLENGTLTVAVEGKIKIPVAKQVFIFYYSLGFI